MTEIIFFYNGLQKSIKIKSKTDNFKDILIKFADENDINLSEYLILHYGKQMFDFNITINEMMENIEREINQITVTLFPKPKDDDIFEKNNEKEEKKENKNSYKNPLYKPPTCEEFYSIILTLKKEINNLKESNYTSIKILKEEIKSLRKELSEYKANEKIRNEKLKKEIKLSKVNNSSNSDKLQNSSIGNLAGCIVKIEQNNKINSNIIFTKGMIISWFGESNNIPENWAICDGTNGTPDLRNRFIIGVSDQIQFGNIGGNTSVQLKKANLPPIGTGFFSCDSHHGWYHHPTNGFIKFQGSYSVSTKNGNDDNWGSNIKIDLTEGMNSSPINIINPYYALFYIMKL